MKYLDKISVTTAVLLSATAFTLPGVAPTDDSVANDQRFVVFELFTSEGCSSCPSADELMTRLQNERSDRPRYILAYHVDYWDRLGWRDPFSDPEFSKRQRQYAAWLGDPQIYTPQLIMNGKSACVGSDEVSIRAFEKKSGDTATAATLAISGLQAAGNMTLQYQARGTHEGSRLLIAAVKKRATSHPKRGENSGRVLNHVQIVRSLSTFNIADTGRGEESIQLPAGFNAGDWEIVAMIQDSTTGEIVAAARPAIH